MHKVLTLLLGLALMATACGLNAEDSTIGRSSLDGDTQLGQPSTDPSAVDSETAEEATAPTEVPPTEVPPTAIPVEQASCIGAGGADRITLTQIPGDGRGDNPSALDNPDDDAFAEPLIDLNRILAGGPPPDGIPPIDSPVFQTASTVDWLRCEEPVLSLSVNGETRAYPVQILTWHEIVNDTFGDVPVAVSFCPLCNSALAYRRDLGDRTVTFGTSGRLFNSSLVMYDRETESLWTHFNGKAVVGSLTGVELELLPMQTTSWKNFLDANPEGLVLTRETGHSRNYGRNPYPGYDDVNTIPFLFDGSADPRLAAKERVVGIRRGLDNAAVVLSALAPAGVIETDVAGDQLSVWHLPGTSSGLEGGTVADGRDIGAVGVYLPVADGQTLTFARDGEVFVDAETGSSWNIQGTAIEGALAGAQLEPVEHLDTFWFALAAFEPETRIITE